MHFGNARKGHECRGHPKTRKSKESDSLFLPSEIL
jgi:hypothetical protein